MKLLIATARNMPDGLALVIAVATTDEVRDMWPGEGDIEFEITEEALLALVHAIEN